MPCTTGFNAGDDCGPPPDVFTEWGDWTPCTRSCGGGTRARRRECALTLDGVPNCKGATLESEDCNTHIKCPGMWTRRKNNK